ncbi:aldehyde dehydrogenase family protein [Limnochorda pilosa]|uniref:Aldehyde dehydrogenase n=1 Tax=Limnochorda pilosa TaxID=1555112 RepID=A0A0K2SHQ9_LIMPI|nr:aldehyde dehydrogenase [Limnochorda pilosa]
MLVGGVWTEGSTGERIESVNPSDRSHLAWIARGVEADIDRAVAAAREAFRAQGAPGWKQVEPAERGRLLYEAARRIRQEAEDLARLESLDNGKPLSQARTDAQVAARYFEYYAGVADKLMGETIPIDRRFLDYTLREPLGVTAHIIPWNYPLQIAARSIAPALAAGNAVVVKPAEEASLSTLELGRILTEAGAPPGVVNIVPGYGEDAGAHLAAHPDVNLVAFTGSVATGTLVMKAAAENVTPVLLELGGKSPNIVFADADLEKAIPTIMRSIYQNAGQTCSAGSRLLAERSIHDRVVEEISRRSRRLRLGPGIEDPDLGPIISESQWKRVLDYVEIARQEGVEVATGGRAPEDERLRGGFFVEPTVLTGVRPEMRVAREEIFGPVLAIIPFDDADEAAELANDTPYGLVAGIWTRDIQVAHRLASRIEAGQVFINTYGAGGGVEMPFGGYKKSGFGREKGLETLRHYTQVKNVCVGLE